MATQPPIAATAIQTPTHAGDNHTAVLKQIKEVVEVGQRLRGNPLDSFVRVSELLNTGVARLVNGVIQPQNVISGSNATLAPQAGPTGSGGVSVSGSYGGGVAITLQSISNNTVLGNVSGITAIPTGLSKAQLTALINAATVSLSGAVPAPGSSTGLFLRDDLTWAAPASGPSLPLSVANGGTGQITAAAAFNALAPMTTTGDMVYDSGAATAARLPIGSSTNILMVSGGIPSWQAQTQITSLGTIGTGTWAGTTIAVGHGGTGITTTPSNGMVPIGNGTTYTAATLTAGAGISIANAAGSITVSTSGIGTTYAAFNNGQSVTALATVCSITGVPAGTYMVEIRMYASANTGTVVGSDSVSAGTSTKKTDGQVLCINAANTTSGSVVNPMASASWPAFTGTTQTWTAHGVTVLSSACTYNLQFSSTGTITIGHCTMILTRVA